MALCEVTRAALGRVARIGSLYDIREDCFLSDSLFAVELGEQSIESIKLGETATDVIITDTTREKCHKLAIEAELQLSFLSGLVKLRGSASFLNEDNKSSKIQSMNLVYNVKTINEAITIRQREVRDKIDKDVLSSISTDTGPTHVVTGIDWGAGCVITCEDENFANRETTSAHGKMSAELEKFKGCIDDITEKGDLEFDEQENEQRSKYRFRCNSDVSDIKTDLPFTFQEAVERAKRMPRIVRETNNGKGVPVTYYLMPLEAVAKMCRLKTKLDITYNAINEAIIDDISLTLNGVQKTKQILRDIKKDIDANHQYLHEDAITTIDRANREISREESQFRVALKEKVKSIRSGHEDISTLETLSKENDLMLPSKFDCAIRDLKKRLENVDLIKSWERKGIKYVGKDNSIDVHNRKNVFVFYKRNDKPHNSKLHKNQAFFLQLQNKHHDDDDFEFLVVENETKGDIWPDEQKNATIFQYADGNLVSKDVCTDVKTNLIHVQTETTTEDVSFAVNRNPVELICPNFLGEGCQCDSSSMIWKCSRCKHLVEYDRDDGMFYCNCGKSDSGKSTYRCSNEKKHGIDYMEYPSDDLDAQLKQQSNDKKVNILVLGETGVGKSTWINGFQYYLNFDDLNDAAESKEFQVLIPSKFIFSGKEIFVGRTDCNEGLSNTSIGESCTNEPRSYIFFVDGIKIRIIDTPGIGDTRGIEVDRKNFHNIMTYISHYREIHAVCILLKPNNSRLNAMFRFCIQELLTQLHTSAKNNIIFCFTNSRGTFYKPGDTLPVLEMLLHEHRIDIKAPNFCFDSESIRFLACMQNGLTDEFDETAVKVYEESWKKSMRETKKLFNYIRTLQQRNVSDTLCVNEARRVILMMRQPLEDVAKAIQMNFISADKAKKQLEATDKSLKEQIEGLRCQGYGIVREPLKHPRTVCAHEECVTYDPIAETDEGVKNVVYKQVCHGTCYLDHLTSPLSRCTGLKHKCMAKGVPENIWLYTRKEKYSPEWIPYLGGLVSSIGMWFTTKYIKALKLNLTCMCKPIPEMCISCGHHYSDHKRISYHTKLQGETFLTDTVLAEIKAKGDEKTNKAAFIKAIDDKYNECKEENACIMKTSVVYASFLRATAIIPYNDAAGDFLDMTIKTEQSKPKAERNKVLLESLHEMKKEYKREKKVFEKASAHSTPETIMEHQKKLFQLKHFGETFKKFFEEVSIENAARQAQFAETTAPIHETSRLKRAWRFFNR